MFKYLLRMIVNAYHWIINCIHRNSKVYFPSDSTPQVEQTTTNPNQNPMTAIQDNSLRSRKPATNTTQDEDEGAFIKLPKKKPVTEVKINPHNTEALYQDESGCSGFSFRL